MSQVPDGEMSSGCVVLAVALLVLHCSVWWLATVLLLAAEGLRDFTWQAVKAQCGKSLCHLRLFSCYLFSFRCGSVLFCFFSFPLQVPVSLLTFPTTEGLINAGCNPELLKYFALFPYCGSIVIQCFALEHNKVQSSSLDAFLYLSLYYFSTSAYVCLVQPAAVYVV